MKNKKLVIILCILVIIVGCSKNKQPNIIDVKSSNTLLSDDMNWHFNILSAITGKVNLLDKNTGIKKIDLKVLYKNKIKKIYDINEYTQNSSNDFFITLERDKVINASKIFFRYSDKSGILQYNDFLEFPYKNAECNTRRSNLDRIKKGEKKILISCGVGINDFKFDNTI